jgi:hypothetical protein
MNVEEVYRATVTDNQDPEKRGRIKVTSAQAVGSTDADLPMWVEHVSAWGWFLIPDVGEQVEIVMASHGDMDESFGQASLEEPDARWRGSRMWTTEDGDVPRPIPKEFSETNYGKRRGFATPLGHMILFDDTEGKSRVSITWNGKPDSTEEQCKMEMDEEGSVIISNKNGSMVYLNAPDEKIEIIDQHGNNVTMESGSITIVADTVDVKAANKVLLGDGADDKAMRANDWISKYNPHQHATAMGPSAGVLVPALGTDPFVSTVVELK